MIPLRDVKPGGLFSWGIEPGKDTCMRLALLYETEKVVIEGQEMDHPEAATQRALWQGFEAAAAQEGLEPWDAALIVHLATGDVCLVDLNDPVIPVESS